MPYSCGRVELFVSQDYSSTAATIPLQYAVVPTITAFTNGDTLALEVQPVAVATTRACRSHEVVLCAAR